MDTKTTLYTARFLLNNQKQQSVSLPDVQTMKGFCLVFGLTLYEDDDVTECHSDFHGLDIIDVNGAPIDTAILVDENIMFTIEANNEESLQSMVEFAQKDPIDFLQEHGLEGDSLKEGCYAAFVGLHPQIDVIHYTDEKVIKGAQLACSYLSHSVDNLVLLCEIEP